MGVTFYLHIGIDKYTIASFFKPSDRSAPAYVTRTEEHFFELSRQGRPLGLREGFLKIRPQWTLR